VTYHEIQWTGWQAYSLDFFRFWFRSNKRLFCLWYRVVSISLAKFYFLSNLSAQPQNSWFTVARTTIHEDDMHSLRVYYYTYVLFMIVLSSCLSLYLHLHSLQVQYNEIVIPECLWGDVLVTCKSRSNERLPVNDADRGGICFLSFLTSIPLPLYKHAGILTQPFHI
jgi:hypothetical protein